MKKVMTNYWVDMITAVAFVLCAVTGLMRLFPEATIGLSSSGQSVILGIPTTYWQTVHDWSGVVMAAGVGVHTALHFKWLVAMTGKVLRGETKSKARAQAPVAAAQGVAAASVARAAQSQRGTATAAAQSPAAGADVSLARLAALSERRPPVPLAQRGFTRKGFLAAAGVAGAAVLVGGWTLLSGKDDSAATSSGTSTSQTYAEADDDISGGHGYGNGNGSSSSSSSDATSGTNGTATTVSTERVVIDTGACNGCAHCVQSCPYGILAMSGNKAVVQNADACQLCGRCVRVCQPQAITLNY